MISSTLQIQESKKYTTTNNAREIGEDGNSDQVVLQNLLGGREKRRGGILLGKHSAMPCALRCYFYLFLFILL